MKRLIGCMAVLCLLALTVGCGGVTNNGTLAYVSNSTGTGFTVFYVDLNGTLVPSPISPVPSSTPSGDGPKVIQFSANGRWAYFLDAGGNYIYAYTRSGNGTLPVFIGPTAVNGASSMVISPNNTYLYVAEPNVAVGGGNKTGVLAVFSIDPANGILTGAGFVDVSYPITQLVMNSSGSLLFGLSPSDATVVSWQLNGTSGIATQSNLLAVGKDPDFMILSANGSYMYIPDYTAVTPNYPDVSTTPCAPNCNSPQFYVYNVGSTGILSPISGQSTLPVFNENADLLTGDFPANPVGGMTSADSRFLFIVNSGGSQGGSISVFKIAATTGQGIPGEPTEVLGSLVTVGPSDTSTASPFPCGCSGASFGAASKTNNAIYVLSESTGTLTNTQ